MTASIMPSTRISRRTRKRLQLADRIAAIAYGLFEKQGYDTITMEQVAATADIAKGTLYKYFPIKEALLAHQFQRDIESGMSPLWQVLDQQNSFAAQLRCLLHASAKWYEARRIYVAAYVRYQLTTANFDAGDAAQQHLPSGARQILLRLCATGQRRGDVRSDLSAGQLAVMLDSMCLTAVMIWLGTAHGNLKDQFDVLLRLALNGVGPSAPHKGTSAA
jgi:AcrR family transcriptional regulator